MTKKILTQGVALVLAAATLGGCAFNPYADKPHPYYTRGNQILTVEEKARQDAALGNCHKVTKETLPTALELALNRGAKGAIGGGVGGVGGQALSLGIAGASITTKALLSAGGWTLVVYGVASAINGEIEHESQVYWRDDECLILEVYGTHSVAPSDAVNLPHEADLPDAPNPQGAPATTGAPRQLPGQSRGVEKTESPPPGIFRK